MPRARFVIARLAAAYGLTGDTYIGLVPDAAERLAEASRAKNVQKERRGRGFAAEASLTPLAPRVVGFRESYPA